MTTTYKGAYLPTVAGDIGAWGTNLNTQTLATFDADLGGIVSVSMASGDVTLDAAQSSNAILRLTGTLTANAQVTTLCKGFTLVDNVTTGAFDVTFANGVGTPVTVPRSQRCLIITDATNGPRLAAQSQSFPSGTVMLFVQTAAPTGWTKSTTHNDKALRIVSGTASSGGTAAFTTAFAARTILEANLPAHTHALTDPGHVHPYTFRTNTTYYGGQDNGPGAWHLDSTGNTGSATTGITLANTGSGTAMDFAVAYVDAILATKD